MTVVFYDVQKETYKRIVDVWQLTACCQLDHGHYINLWCMLFNSGEKMMLAQRYYKIHRIDA